MPVARSTVALFRIHYSCTSGKKQVHIRSFVPLNSRNIVFIGTRLTSALSTKTIIYFFLPLSDILHRGFEKVLGASREEASLSSPEVLRRLECSEDRIPECFHASVLNSRLSEISALNSPGLDFPHVKTSPKVMMETLRSRTITPAPDQQSTNSSCSVLLSDNLSVLDSLDTDRVCDL